jgi:thiol:disulfide interchange protein
LLHRKLWRDLLMAARLLLLKLTQLGTQHWQHQLSMLLLMQLLLLLLHQLQRMQPLQNHHHHHHQQQQQGSAHSLQHLSWHLLLFQLLCRWVSLTPCLWSN